MIGGDYVFFNLLFPWYFLFYYWALFICLIWGVYFVFLWYLRVYFWFVNWCCLWLILWAWNNWSIHIQRWLFIFIRECFFSFLDWGAFITWNSNIFGWPDFTLICIEYWRAIFVSFCLLVAFVGLYHNELFFEAVIFLKQVLVHFHKLSMGIFFSLH